MTASIAHCTISLNLQHNKHSQAAIEAVANALAENAKALAILAKTIQIDAGQATAIRIEDNS